MLTGTVLTYIKSWLNGNPQRYEFEAGSWQINMILEMVRKRFKISCRARTLRGVLGRLGFSYKEPRPIPDKSASETEREEFKQETAGLLEEMSKWGHVVRVCRDSYSISGLFWTLPHVLTYTAQYWVIFINMFHTAHPICGMERCNGALFATAAAGLVGKRL